MASSTLPYPTETIKVSYPSEFVLHVELNRPKKLNAMNKSFWHDITKTFQLAAEDEQCRVVVVSSAARIFTAGLDLTEAVNDIFGLDAPDTARKALKLRQYIQFLQEAFNVIERCPKPVIAAVHGACIGGGVDLVSACDLRHCTADAFFSIKEVDIGLAADLGTLQRLPKAVGNSSLVREWAFTGRKVLSQEAKEAGLVSKVHPDKDAMLKEVLAMAAEIANKSPVAIIGTKLALNYARDHSVEDGLRQIQTWNMGMVQTDDVQEAVAATMAKRVPKFSKL